MHLLKRLAVYTLVSLFAFLGAVSVAALSTHNFFDFICFLLFKKFPLFLLFNVIGSVFLSVCAVTLTFTLGSIRDLEAQSMVDAGKTILLDTALFLLMAGPTVNDRDVGHGNLIVCVSLLLILKLLHLISTSRATHLVEAGLSANQPMGKLAALLTFLGSIDTICFVVFYKMASFHSTFYIWMTFELTRLLTTVALSMAKLSVVFVDVSLEETGWPLKSEHVFLLDVINDICDMAIFLAFLWFFVYAGPVRIPFYLAHDFIQIVRVLAARITSFIRYREFTARLNTDIPDASLQELIAADTCIICRDILTLGSKKLSCGHVLHLACIRSWFIHHQSCPTCRTEISSDRHSFTSSEATTSPARRSEGVQSPPQYTFGEPPCLPGERTVNNNSTQLIGWFNKKGSVSRPTEEGRLIPKWTRSINWSLGKSRSVERPERNTEADQTSRALIRRNRHRRRLHSRASAPLMRRLTSIDGLLAQDQELDNMLRTLGC